MADGFGFGPSLAQTITLPALTATQQQDRKEALRNQIGLIESASREALEHYLTRNGWEVNHALASDLDSRAHPEPQ